MNLSSTIKSIQDIMRKDDGVDGDAQRLGQLTWMLFLKVFDQREEGWEKDAKKSSVPYISPIPEQFRWRNWAAPTGSERKANKLGFDLIEFVNAELFPSLKAIEFPTSIPSEENITRYELLSRKLTPVIREVFRDANNFMKSGPLMFAVIEKLEKSINFHDFTTRSQLGDVYEQLLNDLRGAGNAGEFYTPRAITQLMTQMVNPKLDKKETVLDPACGTGGFLTAAIEHFRTQAKESSFDEENNEIEKLIFGIEKKQLPHLLCSTNMLIHGLEVPDQIEHMNTLGQRDWSEWGAKHQRDCVITNPPFGGYEDDEVGRDFPSDLRTKETADMFMALIVKKLLKDGGRAAVVLPDGFMFGGGIKGKLKEMLLRECNLHTIIRLPKGVFAPYTTIKTNLLFFTRKGPSTNGSKSFATEDIWFYEHPYPEGYKSYSKTKPIRIEEFAPEKDWWGNEENNFSEREENEFAWKYPFRKKREQALVAAQPLWDKAKQLNDRASDLEASIRLLREDLKGTKNCETREQFNQKISQLQAKSEPLRLQAKDAKAAGDRIYWPIYNLDIKNPNTIEESQDPDELLIKYKKLLGEIEEIEEQLKNELAAVFSPHFSGEDV
ncbi:restriction endonuclease subunit M [Vibrio sp. 10N.222.47.A9]|uniref:class I SAM-dependent DNA methyltransferase n=1 Tax=Vibrio sp. 10N.222.47.A9 TaxID=1903178 RepID=UPI000978BB0B|nr:N-6 DNA methylase [Vibrio sp. 10N.222.47.A9]OMO28491.1 restriction endonuclease subunit M [Vibrio sp. 10N.222.47.A9]